jgi:indolepyruvate ferredoxin oxidoreductase, alpha subunit
MVYNPPPTGHLVLILDNGTTAMTGQQEHPGTGRLLDHSATNLLNFEETARAMGVQNVHVMDTTSLKDDALRDLITDLLAKNETSLIVTRQPCVLAAPKIRLYEKANAEQRAATCAADLVD